MDIESISDKLRKFKTTAKNRPKIALLRDLLEPVETAISDGASVDDVLALLASGGLEMSRATFFSYMARIRKKSGTGPNRTPQVKPAPVGTSAPTVAVSAPAPTRQPEHASPPAPAPDDNDEPAKPFKMPTKAEMEANADEAMAAVPPKNSLLNRLKPKDTNK